MKSAECHKHKHTSQSFFDSRNLPDRCRGYQQRSVQSSSFNRSDRSPDAVASYYSSSTSYKPTNGYSCLKPSRPKCVQPYGGEVSHHGLQTHLKLDRTKHCPPNAMDKGKIRYEDGLGNEKFKYADELDNLMENNGDEDVEEEEEDQADADEFLNKEYDEHEADDEVEEESDPSPQTHRAQRACKKEAELRQQRWKAIDQQQDPRRQRCQQRVLALGQGHSPTPRYYYHEHEVPEPLSEEDFVPTSMKNLTRRSTDYHRWSPSRCESNRYDLAPSHAQSRRTRTKPDVNQFLEAEHAKTRKCHRCGTLSSRKSMSPSRNSCRLNDRVSFPTKGPIGDEPESHDQLFCGHCILRHNPEVINDGPPPQYATKSHKCRDTKSPKIYQMPEPNRIEQVPSDYSRTSSRYHRKPMDHEKTKRSLHNSYCLPHLLSRHVE